MGDGGQKLTGVIEDDAPWLVGTILGRTPEEMEFAAKKVILSPLASRWCFSQERGQGEVYAT